jgi:plastocyanin
VCRDDLARAAVLAAGLVLGAVARPAQGATIQIVMDKMVISPAEVSAKVGDTIEWVNRDILAHTATARNGDFDVMLPATKNGSFVLKKAGTIDYYCRFHPNMKATLVVSP